MVAVDDITSIPAPSMDENWHIYLHSFAERDYVIYNVSQNKMTM